MYARLLLLNLGSLPHPPHPHPSKQGAELVKEMSSKWPMLRHMVLVLKLFLQQRELNEVGVVGVGACDQVSWKGTLTVSSTGW